MFIRLGHFAARVEVRANQIVVAAKGDRDGVGRGVAEGKEIPKADPFIPHLSDDFAFLKGVEYFSEIVFFYGLLAGMVIYEVGQAYRTAGN